MMSLRTLIVPLAFAPFALSAQFAINPQLGIDMTKLSGDDDLLNYSAEVGFMIGGDLRIGSRFYFQPGAFYISSQTAVSVDGAVDLDNSITTSKMKLKGLVGYNLIDGDAFRLRLNAGPTYNFILNVSDEDGSYDNWKDDFNSGSFNLDAGLGADISIITLESGISYGLSKAYKDQDGFSSDAKYFTLYLTAGLVFGGSH
jgi:hypothetical protein